MARRSAQEVKLLTSFESARNQLLDEKYADRLDKPLAFWARFDDRSLPLALLDRSLRDVLATPYCELTKTRGVGQKKIQTLLTLLERATTSPSPEAAVGTNGTHNGTAGSNGKHFDPGQVSDAQWTRWCAKAKRFDFGDLPLGRVAPTLQALPTVIWDTPISSYYDISLDELRSLKNHGVKRIRAVLEVFYVLDESLGCVRLDHLATRLVPRFVEALEAWISEVAERDDPPTADEIRDQLIWPMLQQIRRDLGDMIADLATRRLGAEGSSTTVQRLATEADVTRARIYQLLEQCGDVMRVRWPEGRRLLAGLQDTISAGNGDVEATSLLGRARELFFPTAIRAIAASDEPEIANHQAVLEHVEMSAEMTKV